MPQSGDSSDQPAKPADELDILASVCIPEAQLLLNCVASSNYNEYKCLPLLRKLRSCVEKKYVVDFTLLPDAESARQASAEPTSCS